jgi:hypothetical protein
MNETIVFDPRQYQNILLQTFGEAYKSHAPTWLESLVAFIQLHPWMSIGIAAVFVALVSAIIREILCEERVARGRTNGTSPGEP